MPREGGPGEGFEGYFRILFGLIRVVFDGFDVAEVGTAEEPPVKYLPRVEGR